MNGGWEPGEKGSHPRERAAHILFAVAQSFWS
jgi:hypothetical protein